MIFSLNKYVYKRQYDKYTLLTDVLNRKSYVFECAGDFSAGITHDLCDTRKLAMSLAQDFDWPIDTVQNDLDEYVRTLGALKIVQIHDQTFNGAAVETEVCVDVSNSATPQELLSNYFMSNPTLVNLQIDITQACTERCIHCYIPEYRSEHLPLEDAEHVISWFADNGGLSLSISGGECMMHPGFNNIISFAASRDIAVKVFTNLTLCTDDTITLLKGSCARVQTSLYSLDEEVHDGITRVHGSLRKTRYWLERLLHAGVPCEIACPLMKENLGGYSDVRNYAGQLNVPLTTDYTIIGRTDRSTDNLAHRLSVEETESVLATIASASIKDNPDYFKRYFQSECFSRVHEGDWLTAPLCDICISTMCLDAMGNFHPCSAFTGITLGNCRKDSLDWIWKDSPETLRLRSLRGHDVKQCCGCPDRPYCNICPCRNYNETGDMLLPSQYFCEIARANRRVVESYRSAMTFAQHQI